MTSARRTPLLAPLAYLYGLVQVASSANTIDAMGSSIAILGLFVAGLPLVALRGQARKGEHRVGALALFGSIAILGSVAPSSRSILVELAWAWAAPLVVGLTLDLARDVPDAPPRVLTTRRLRVMAIGSALALVSLGGLVVFPMESVLGPDFLVSTAYRRWCMVGLIMTLCAAFVVRARRRLYGSTTEARASNGWALLGIGLAFALLMMFMLSAKDSIAQRVCWALAMSALALGHVWLIDARRRLSFDRVFRELVTAIVAVAIVTLGSSVTLLAGIGRGAHAIALLSIACLGTVALTFALRPVVRWLFAPVRGRLLDAIEVAITRVAPRIDPMELCREVLGPIDRVSDADTARSTLFLFDPDRAFQTDRAGEPHPHRAAFSPTIRAQILKTPGDLIVTDEVAPRLVRHPEERPLHEALLGLDALVVVPLWSEGVLEGALIVARGTRSEALRIEETHRLRELGSILAARASIASSTERLHRRADDAERRVAALLKDASQVDR